MLKDTRQLSINIATIISTPIFKLCELNQDAYKSETIKICEQRRDKTSSFSLEPTSEGMIEDYKHTFIWEYVKQKI